MHTGPRMHVRNVRKDHVKYLRHRTCEPHTWIMVPLRLVQQSPRDAVLKHVERLLLKQLRPNINTPERPFWLLRDTYAAAYKSAAYALVAAVSADGA